MPRKTLDREIHHLQDEVLLLGSMVEQSMLNAIDTLKRRDLPAARQVYNNDDLINEKRYAIENRVLILFATQQPIAHDLRLMAAILEVITELERMGDYAKGIAKINLLIGEDDTPIPIRDISRMGDLAVGMLHRALSAFINEDVSMAHRIPKEDDLVDELYNEIYRKNVAGMIANPDNIDHSNYIMWVVHNIERMADRVTNICERTIFIATGELLEIDVSDDEWLYDDDEDDA
jgi:phosphate transport system protein